MYLQTGEHELKYNVSLKVQTGEALSFYSLLSAGESCFEAEKECEVILDDSAKINFWLQYPESDEARVETLELTDLPDGFRLCVRISSCVYRLRLQAP